ncbi:MAG: F0F1 ATP synthase subunit A [Rubrivivax sp.]|nr:F0F1 ATP synthase subunit A [Rubrivivax sp.]
MNAIGDGAGWSLGALTLREPLLLSFGVSVGLLALSLWLGRHAGQPAGRLARAADALYLLMRDAVAEVVPAPDVARVLPFVGSLWLFVLVSNLLGLVPGLESPTRDLSITAALAAVVFVAVHVYGVRASGWRAYLKHYLAPNPILLPFHLISEVTRTLALAIRLFGNMMSLEMAAMLVLLVAGLLVPVPLLLLHVVEALVQAYIFGMLALIYIGSALEIHQQRAPHDEPPGTPGPDSLPTEVSA